MSRRLKGNIFLFTAALFWGSTFVAQEMAAKQYHIGAFSYQSTRMLIGSVVLLPLIFFMTFISKKKGTYKKPTKKDRKTLIIAGVVCGSVLCIASCLQQLALQDKATSSGKIAFITALYILLVPIIYMLFGNKVQLKVIVAALMGAVGLYFLSVQPETFSVSHGDFLGILCALGFSVHILVVDYFAPKVDGVKLSSLQFLVCGLIALIPTVIFEKPQIIDLLKCWGPILYAGILSCGVAYTFQILGQQNTSPAMASILMSLESAFGVLTGVVIVKILPSTSVWLKTPEPREWLGCAIMFVAIIISQLPSLNFTKNKK